MEKDYRKSLDQAIKDGDAVETGIPLKIEDYTVELPDGQHFMITAKCPAGRRGETLLERAVARVERAEKAAGAKRQR